MSNFSLLDGLMRQVCLLIVCIYFIMIIDQQNVGTFSDGTFSSTTVCYVASQEAPINIFFWASCLFLKTLSTWFLCFDHWFFSHLVANLFPSFCPFVVLFWMLQMLVTMSKWCRVPHALQVTTWTIFLETFFVSARNESNLGHLLSC